MQVSVANERADIGDAVTHFREHGWAKLGRVADAESLGALRSRADDIMLGRVVHEGLFFQLDTPTGHYEDLAFGRGWEGPSLHYRKVEKLERDPTFRAWLENAVFERVARAVVGDDVVLYRAVLFNKGPHGGTELPWHQDGGSFWGIDRDPELQIWTALDDATESSGCVEVLDASHRWGLATPLGGTIPRPIVARVLEGEGAEPPRGGPDTKPAALAVPALAGEVLLIHSHVWHRSGINTTGHPRRAFTVTYMPASTRCLRRRRAPRQFVRVFQGSRDGAEAEGAGPASPVVERPGMK